MSSSSMPESSATKPPDQGRLRLDGLPGDILDYLSIEHLDSLSFFNLRQTCRNIRDQTSRAFGRRYFKHMKFLLSCRSLIELKAISSDNQLSEFIRHISLGTERLNENMGQLFYPPGPAESRAKWIRNYGEIYQVKLLTQNDMEHHSLDTKVLIYIFMLLPNLESVGVGGPDIAHTKAERVYDMANMQPWGIEHLIRTLGASDDSISNDDSESSIHKVPDRHMMLRGEPMHYHAFHVMFDVLHELELASRKLKLDLHIRVPEFGTVMPIQFSRPGTRAALSNTRSLTLDFTRSPDFEGKVDWWVEGLLQRTTSATSIQLMHGHNLEASFGQLARGHFTNLKALKLEAVVLHDMEILLDMLRRVSSTVQSVDFSDVQIERRNEDPELLWGEGFARRNKWNEVLGVLLSFPHLESVSLRLLIEYRGYSKKVLFSDEEEGMADYIGEGDPVYELELADRKYYWSDELKLHGRQEIADILEHAVTGQLEFDCPYRSRAAEPWLWWGSKLFRTAFSDAHMRNYPPAYPAPKVQLRRFGGILRRH
ncbi:hypothetical protein BU16DRAFT_53083 [Lophium mytilinum]|uniref:Uncharacterized protein n=1 Tax=Lophium mytilinum TaxID=390894 RepID=A0A6A6QS76_9PEZI|nr:hypothetical protein BU16DRAFT_53083 [Lophium mytilinum]